MIHVEEINDDVELNGQLISISKSAGEKFIEWQKSHKIKLKVISVQKTNTGLFVVYEK
jgi:hypothetical protein